MASNMLSLPVENPLTGESSMMPGGGSLFNPNQLSLPVTGGDDAAIDAFMRQNNISDIVEGRAAYYNQQQQPPSPYGSMTPGQALGGELTQQQTSPVIANPFSQIPVGPEYNTVMGPMPGQQLNTPSLDQLAKTQPFAPPPSVPVALQPPQTQQLVQQIGAPTTGAPTPPVPTPTQSPTTQQLIGQIGAATAPKPILQPMRAPAMNQATQQFAQQFKPPVARTVAPPRPVIPARPQAQRQFQSVAARAPARSVSRVNPPLLPSRPMGRR